MGFGGLGLAGLRSRCLDEVRMVSSTLKVLILEFEGAGERTSVCACD